MSANLSDPWLENTAKYVQESNITNSLNDKLEVLSRYSEDDHVKQTLYFTYNSLLNYNVTVEQLKKRKDLTTESKFNNIVDLLNSILFGDLKGHDSIKEINGYIQKFPEHEDLIYKIINRNLETRVTATSINKAIPDLIPEFKVALCEDYRNFKANQLPKFDQEIWYASRKLDGVRVIAIVDREGRAKFFSRQGKEFHTLEILATNIRCYADHFANLILDGEVCLTDENGEDDFQGVMKQISRKDYDIPNPKFNVFDILTPEEFHGKVKSPVFSDRLKRFKQSTYHINLLKQHRIWAQPDFESLKVASAREGWEGLIIRKDIPYEGKRSKNMLKVKEFHDAEFTVESIETGPFRVIVQGKEETIETLTNVIISYKGNPVSVGSGFSLDQRRRFYDNPQAIIGKVITVKYFQESQDQYGKPSLRFPVVKTVHGDTREV